MKALAGLIVLTMLGSPVLAQESVYTPTQGPACRDSGFRSAFNIWRCPGPAGYVVEFADEGNVATMAIGRPRDKGQLGRPMSWRGAERVFGDKLEWRVVNGKPVAAILRIWRSDTDSEGSERIIQELLVMRILSQAACRIGAIDTRQGNANLIAQQLADTGACVISEQLD